MSSEPVYVGAWTNWSKGIILGSTLTIPTAHGTILIATLALLVRWAGSHFWGIICFIIHHFRSTTVRERDGLHYQHQALLRNKLSETDFLWRLYETGWAWRSSVPRSFKRSIPLVVLSSLNIAVFLIAGIFSSRVTSIDSEALLRGYCGWLESTADKDFPLWTKNDWDAGDVLFVTAYNGYRGSLAYSQTCYGGNFANTTNSLCNRTPVPLIKSYIDRDAPCPFADSVCSGPAMTIDTGFFDSHKHLGINARPKDRIRIRKKTSCAPIPLEKDFATNWTTEKQPGVEIFLPGAPPEDTTKYYSIGSSWLFGVPVSNFTFVVSNYSLGVNGAPYKLDVRTSYTKNFTESGFLPIPELNRTDADVTVLTLNNRVAYTGKVDDPFFQAPLPLGGNRLGGAWVSNTTLTGVACTEQYAYCNNDICTDLGGLYDFDSEKAPPNMDYSELQLATYRLLRKIFYFMRFNSFLVFLKGEVLVSNRLVYGSFGISSALPNNQWQTEMENIHNISLAGVQNNVISHVYYPNTRVKEGLYLYDHMVPETEPNNLYLCANQKILTSTHASFNMFGLMLTVLVSFIIILLDVSLPNIVHTFQRRSGKGEIQRRAWEDDDILQLQRIGLEGQGFGPWKGRGEAVPVTTGYDLKFSRDRAYGYDKDIQLNESFEPLRKGSPDVETKQIGTVR